MAYLKNLLTIKKLPIFIKLLLRIKAFRTISAKLVIQLLKNIYGLRQSNKL